MCGAHRSARVGRKRGVGEAGARRSERLHARGRRSGRGIDAAAAAGGGGWRAGGERVGSGWLWGARAQPVRKFMTMSEMNHKSTRKLSQNHWRYEGQSSRSKRSSPTPHMALTMSTSKAISNGTAMPQ